MKLIIAGSRDYNNYEEFKEATLDFLANHKDVDEIVSGGARGVDKMGERLSVELGIKLTIFPADWNTHGKKAGYLRNKQMAEYADGLLAFWDAKSKGTEHMCKLSMELGLKVYLNLVS